MKCRFTGNLIRMILFLLFSGAAHSADEKCIRQEKTIDVPEFTQYSIALEEELCDDVAHSDEMSMYMSPKNHPSERTLILKYDYDPLVGDASVTWIDQQNITVHGHAATKASVRLDRAYDVKISYDRQ